LLPAPTAPSEGSAGLHGPDPEGSFPKVLAHQLRRRFPSNSSLRRGDRPSNRLRFPKARLPFNYRCLAKPKPSDVLRPFLGRPLLRPALLLPSEDFLSRVALEEDQLFRRLFPTGPELLRRVSHCLSAEIGPSVTLRFLLAVSGLPVEAGTSVPITLEQCTSRPSRGSKKFGHKPVDNGDIGNNRLLLCHNRESRLARFTFRSRQGPG
jgi:hypothetical protein